MRNVLAMITAMVVLAGSSMAYACCPSSSACSSNSCWSKDQSACACGEIFGGLCSCKGSDDAQKDLDSIWCKLFGSLDGCPKCPDKSVGSLCEDKLFLELLLVILFELHQCPTHSGCC